MGGGSNESQGMSPYLDHLSQLTFLTRGKDSPTGDEEEKG